MTNNCVFQAEEKLAPAQSRSYPPPRRGACKRSAAAHLEINAMISSSLLESMKASSPTDPRPKPTSETAVSDWNVIRYYFPNKRSIYYCLECVFNLSCGQKRHPSALKVFDEITAAAKGKKIVMFLDYDGTLSPIVDDPDSAFMSDAMRETVRCVAKHFPTAIVSGRCRDKIFGFVQLAELYYAGSHGMDIKGPTQCPNHANVQPKTVLCQPATAFISTINQVYNVLLEKTRMIPGAKVENNRFCLSVHFRCVEEKVLEIRPAIEWDKGKALEFLLEELGFADRTDILPVYIGDDRTDEDAFKALRSRGQGFGILVSKFPKETFANYSLKEPSEVKDFLRRLVEWMRTSVKALHRAL